MLNSSLISVIMPVYNAEQYIHEAIKSILNQTYKNFEFIIINDGSTDKSLEIIEKYAKKDKRIKIISRENKGLIYSLNEGIKQAKGKYIARMDADDISLPNRFEKQIKLMKNKNLDVCGGHYLLIDKENNIQGLNLTPLSHQTCFLSLVSKVPFAHPSVIIRRGFLKKHNLLYGQTKYKIAEDLDLWFRMYEKGAVFGNINEILFKYRILDNSLSKINSVNLRKDTKSMQEIFLNKNKNKLINTLINAEIFNKEELSVNVRVVFKLYIKRLRFIQAYKYLKNINIKVVICTILSELKS